MPLSDRIPELVKEFKVLLGSHLRGDTIMARERKLRKKAEIFMVAV